MKALIIFALVNAILAISYLLLYIWHSIRRTIERFRRAFKATVS
jgi:hypothetical protein